MEVKQWVDTDSSTSIEEGSGGHKSKLVENDWARAWGRVKAFGGRRHVGAHVIRPIRDKNEITYHLLEATYVHLYFTRGPPPSDPGAPQAGGGATGYGEAAASALGGVGGGQSVIGGQSMSNVSPAARRVYQAIKSTPQNNEGLHVQNIAATIGMNVNDVMKAGDELLSHSLIYTTVDDLTWAALDF